MSLVILLLNTFSAPQLLHVFTVVPVLLPNPHMNAPKCCERSEMRLSITSTDSRFVASPENWKTHVP